MIGPDKRECVVQVLVFQIVVICVGRRQTALVPAPAQGHDDIVRIIIETFLDGRAGGGRAWAREGG